MKLQFVFLAPWIILTAPSRVFFGTGTLVVLAIIAIGSFGLLAGNQVLATLSSMALLFLLVAGKVGTDLVKSSAPDTAVLLFQFVAVLYFMEASIVVLSFEREETRLAGRNDDLSRAFRERLRAWVKGQLTGQAKLVAGALGLSLFLLALGGLSSVSINQFSFSAVLVLFVVGILLFLITQRREPERPSGFP